MDCRTPGFPVLHYFLEFVKTHVHWVHDAIQPCHPMSSPSLPALNLSQHQGLFQWVHWVLHIRWPKYWSFSFSVGPSNEYSRLISFSMDWFYLAVQCTLRVFSSTTIQRISSLGLSLLHSPTLTPIHDYWKNHSFDYMGLCQQSDVSLLNTLSMFVTAFLPRRTCLLISGLQSLSTVILEPKKIKCHFLLFPLLFAVQWWDWMPAP